MAIDWKMADEEAADLVSRLPGNGLGARLINLAHAYEDLKARTRPEEAKGGMAMLMDTDGTRDTRRFEWLEANNTLHKSVEILYVVDGYEIQVMHEDGVTELSPPYRGDTIRAAIDEALRVPQEREGK